jgi:hypothetical protein
MDKWLKKLPKTDPKPKATAKDSGLVEGLDKGKEKASPSDSCLPKHVGPEFDFEKPSTSTAEIQCRNTSLEINTVQNVMDLDFDHEEDVDDPQPINLDRPTATPTAFEIGLRSSENVSTMPKPAPLPKPKATSTGKKKIYKFNQAWLKEPQFSGWLKKQDKCRGKSDIAYCKVCDVDMSAHRTEILRHSKSARHIKLSAEISYQREITSMVETPLSQQIKRAELKLAGLVAANNLPFRVMDSLGPLCKDLFPDSKIAQGLAIKRMKTTHVVKNALGVTFLELLYQNLRKPGNYFSLIMDETTDRGSSKQCALTVIYTDETTGSVKTNFFDMYEVASSTAEELFKSLIKSIESKGIPLTNLVAFSSDTTNVMVGHHNSVFSLLKQALPHIACIKCSCHMIHLAACKACLKLPKSVEDMLRNIGSHFSRSYGRQEKFREFQEFFHVEIHKILSPATTRWLSLKQCVDRVLEQYAPLQSYFILAAHEEHSATIDSVVTTMNNQFMKLYLEFMSYTLGILNDFNVLFQSETPLLHRLKPEVEKMLKDLCSNYMDVSYIRNTNPFKVEHSNPRYFQNLEDIYLGILAQCSFTEMKNDQAVPKSEIELFLKTCLNFYVELVTEIKNRFDFSDELFTILNILEPKTAQEFSTKSLSAVFIRFPMLKDISKLDLQKTDSEWKNHALLDHSSLGLDPSRPALEYWTKVFNLKTALGEPAFPNLQVVLKLLFILPFSNTSVERVFSTLNDCKTNERNRLKTSTVVSLMATREGINDRGGIVKFEPTREMMRKNIWQ